MCQDHVISIEYLGEAIESHLLTPHTRKAAEISWGILLANNVLRMYLSNTIFHPTKDSQKFSATRSHFRRKFTCEFKHCCILKN